MKTVKIEEGAAVPADHTIINDDIVDDQPIVKTEQIDSVVSKCEDVGKAADNSVVVEVKPSLEEPSVSSICETNSARTDNFKKSI